MLTENGEDILKESICTKHQGSMEGTGCRAGKPTSDDGDRGAVGTLDVLSDDGSDTHRGRAGSSAEVKVLRVDGVTDRAAGEDQRDRGLVLAGELVERGSRRAVRCVVLSSRNLRPLSTVESVRRAPELWLVEEPSRWRQQRRPEGR